MAPGRHRAPRRSWTFRTLAAASTLLLAAAAFGFRSWDERSAEAGRSGATAFTGPPGPTDVAGVPAGVVGGNRSSASPVVLSIPAIGVLAQIVRLGLNPDGTLQVPRAFDEAGWWTGSTLPGERGSAVILGHVDSFTGPAVFYRIRDLEPGDRVYVWGADGVPASFVVQRVEQYPKNAFPTGVVYGAVRYPALRLVTCGGSFDFTTHHYRDNIVVFARGSSPVSQSLRSPGDGF